MAPVEFLISHSTIDGTPITDMDRLIRPMNLNFEFNINEPNTVSYDVSLSNEYVGHDWVSPWATDWALYINDGATYDMNKIMDGVHTSHEVADTGEVASVGGSDYLEYFNRRGYPFDPTVDDITEYPYTVQWDDTKDLGTDIITDIINQILSLDNSLDGVTLNIPTLGPYSGGVFQIQFADTSSLGDFISTFAAEYPGFDYGFLPDKQFWIWKTEFDPTHNAVYTFIEEEDGSLDGVLSLKFNNTGPGGTHALGTGAGIATGSFAQNYEYLASSLTYRRLDIFPNFDNVIGLSQLQRLTAGSLGIALAPIYEITMVVDPAHIEGFWNKFVPGAYIFIVKDLIAHKLDGWYKIVQMQGAVDNEGQCLVTINLNRETDISLTFSDTNP